MERNMAEMVKALTEIHPGVKVLPASSEKYTGKEEILGIIDAGLKGKDTATNGKTLNI